MNRIYLRSSHFLIYFHVKYLSNAAEESQQKPEERSRIPIRQLRVMPNPDQLSLPFAPSPTGRTRQRSVSDVRAAVPNMGTAPHNPGIRVGTPVLPHHVTNKSIVRPPLDTSRIFDLFMSPAHCGTFIGDLEERYGAIVQHEGSRAATIWFWLEVLHSFFSLAFDALKRISGIEKLYRRIGS